MPKKEIPSAFQVLKRQIEEIPMKDAMLVLELTMVGPEKKDKEKKNRQFKAVMELAQLGMMVKMMDKGILARLSPKPEEACVDFSDDTMLEDV